MGLTCVELHRFRFAGKHVVDSFGNVNGIGCRFLAVGEILFLICRAVDVRSGPLRVVGARMFR